MNSLAFYIIDITIALLVLDVLFVMRKIERNTRKGEK